MEKVIISDFKLLCPENTNDILRTTVNRYNTKQTNNYSLNVRECFQNTCTFVSTGIVK
jgi:hypothetical protein